MASIRKIQDILLWLIFSFALLLLVVYWSKLFQADWLLIGCFFAGICLLGFTSILFIMSLIQKRFRKIMVSSAALFLCLLVFEIPAMERSLAVQRAEQINKKFNNYYNLIDK